MTKISIDNYRKKPCNDGLHCGPITKYSCENDCCLGSGCRTISNTFIHAPEGPLYCDGSHCGTITQSLYKNSCYSGSECGTICNSSVDNSDLASQSYCDASISEIIADLYKPAYCPSYEIVCKSCCQIICNSTCKMNNLLLFKQITETSSALIEAGIYKLVLIFILINNKKN